MMNQNFDSRLSEADTKAFSKHIRDFVLSGVFVLVWCLDVDDTEEENGSYVDARRIKRWQSGCIRAIIEMSKLRPSEAGIKLIAYMFNVEGDMFESSYGEILVVVFLAQYLGLL